MENRRSGGKVNGDGNSHTEPSVMHRVPNSSRSGKGIVRRPTVPLSSVPEQTNGISPPSDFMEKSADILMSSGQPKPPTLAIRTTSPFAEPNSGSSAVHITSTPKPKFDPVRAFRNSFLGKQAETDDPSGSVARWKGKEKALPPLARNDSMERLRQSRLSAKAIEIREWLQGKSGTGTNRTAPDTSRKIMNGNAAPPDQARQPKKGSIRSLFKNHRPAPSPKDRGPKPGQTYEIVKRRVVENNPEKTVEISTWREQTVKRTRSTEDEMMSIYYISADEYPQEGDYANTTMAKVEWKIDAPDMLPVHSRTGSSRSGNKDKLINGDVYEKEQQASVLHRQHSSSISMRQAISPVQRSTISPTTSEKDPSSLTKANAIQVTVEEVNTAGSSTPVRNPNPRRVPRQIGRYKGPSQCEKELPLSPGIQLTRTGSTMSCSKAESAVQFEDVLQSCEPSLMHIAPMLRTLGIRKQEHLKAVGKLTPLIRDREIKEDALRLGITVVEWAILLDKVSKLYL